MLFTQNKILSDEKCSYWVIIQLELIHSYYLSLSKWTWKSVKELQENIISREEEHEMNLVYCKCSVSQYLKLIYDVSL